MIDLNQLAISTHLLAIALPLAFGLIAVTAAYNAFKRS